MTKVEKKKIMIIQKGQRGYLQIGLTKNRKHKTWPIHRIVAITFIENNENKREVNHIDGNKYNNSVNNLEWVTPSENMTHAYRSGLKIIRGIKKVNQYNKNKDFIKSWDSIIDVQKQLGISKSSISKCCKNKAKTAGKFIWEYAI